MGEGEGQAGPRHVEWDAAAYHRISDPQFRWGMRVIERLPLRGDEVVMDAGCGSGRLTAELAARLPEGAGDRGRRTIRRTRWTTSGSTCGRGDRGRSVDRRGD